MVKQRFRVLFRRWVFTVMKFCGPILLYELFCVGPAALSVCAPRHVGFADGSVFGCPAHGLAVLAVGTGRVDMVQAVEVTGLRERAAGSSRSYWTPEAVRINKS
jgi:hypothetical protein